MNKTKQQNKQKTFKLTATSLVPYTAIVKARNEEEAWAYVSSHSEAWKQADGGDWQDESCEELNLGCEATTGTE